MRFLFSLGTAVLTALLVTAPAFAQTARTAGDATGSRSTAGAVVQTGAPAIARIEAQPTALRGTVMESFDDITTLPGAGWALINNSQPLGTTGWFQGNPTTFPSQAGAPNAYIGANFNNTTGGTGTISNWLITPVVSLANGTELTFWSRATGQQFPDRLEVRMSTNGASTDVGTTATSVGDFQTLMLSINPTLTTTGYPTTWTQYTVTVSGMSSSMTGRFAFRYFVTGAGPAGDNSNYIGIDEVSISQPPGAAVITVNTNFNGIFTNGDCSLAEAIQAANTGMAVDACPAGGIANTITFDPSLAGATIGAQSMLISRALTIDGSSAPGLTIDGSVGPTPVRGVLPRIFTTLAGEMFTLRSLTLARGTAERGGAVFVEAGGMLTVENVTFVANEATGATAGVDGGGAIYLDTGATALITGSTFQRNRATGAAGSGGALFNNAASVTITNTQFTSNTANRAGGAIEAVAGTTTLTNTQLIRNDTGSNPGNGGGLHVTGAGTVSITGGLVRFNNAVEGGGLWCAAACTMTLTEVNVQNNTATGGSTALKGGGGLFNLGTMTVVNSVISGNQATSTDGTLGSGGGILNVGGTLSVVGGTIQNNSAPRAGGGIETNAGSVTLNDVTFQGNLTGPSPGNGGALHATGAATVTANGGTVRNNIAAREGGGFWNDSGTMTITNTSFASNSANGPALDDGGGALFNNGGTLIATDIVMRDNRATGTTASGGAAFSLGGTMTLTRAIVRNNLANRAGGGIESIDATVTLNDVIASGNGFMTPAPGNGGGVHAAGGSLTINGGRYVNNVAVNGGGVWASGMLRMAPSADGPVIVNANTATGAVAPQGGGGVYVQTGGNATIIDTRIANNAATGTAGSGGGLFVADGASATVRGGEIVRNRANRAGAGIEVFDGPATPGVGSLTLERVMVNNNAIETAAPGNGGGLHTTAGATAIVRQSTFSRNTAREGGGIWIAGAGSLMLELSTVSGNTATEDGGGVYDAGGAMSAMISITDATVFNNTAGGMGGGLFSQSTDGSRFTFMNTIVARNNATMGGADCSGNIQSQGHNLIQRTAGCTISGDTGTNLTGVNPMLGPLADNGGPTLTHLPMEGSPVINAGMSSRTMDQRGFMPADAMADIGSVERGATMPAPLAEGGTGEDTLVPDEAAVTVVPAEFALAPPSPNPARGEATVRFTLAEAGPTTLTLYDALGRVVSTLYDGEAAAATAHVARVPAGLAPGVYVLRLVSGAEAATSRLTVVR